MFIRHSNLILVSNVSHVNSVVKFSHVANHWQNYKTNTPASLHRINLMLWQEQLLLSEYTSITIISVYIGVCMMYSVNLRSDSLIHKSTLQFLRRLFCIFYPDFLLINQGVLIYISKTNSDNLSTVHTLTELNLERWNLLPCLWSSLL